MKKHNKKAWSRFRLFLMFSATVFALIYLCGATIFYFFYLVRESPFLDITQLPKHITEYLIALLSAILGIVLAVFFRNKILKPIHQLSEATDKISQGDYKVSIPLSGFKSIRTLSEKTNSMAEELDNIETLRNDFINNFSHEFKTPIVSIGGFAKLLKNKNLTDEEKEEYIDIIISESERLSKLSNNILIITRLENQNTLSNKSEFNVSEQIRLVIAVLLNKWSSKNIDISFEGEDYIINADKDLLQMLWTNLIDNAYKYSPDKSEIIVTLKKIKSEIVFTIKDSGKGMSEHDIRHAFDKFYQGDVSHKKDGNGIGLSVAKRICELHEGDIIIRSSNENGTCFEVTLPTK